MKSKIFLLFLSLLLTLAVGCASAPILNVTHRFRSTPFDQSAIANLAAGLRYTDFPEVRVAELPFSYDAVWAATIETLKDRGDALVLADKDDGDIVTDLAPHWGVGLHYSKIYVNIENISPTLTKFTYLFCGYYQDMEIVDGSKTGKIIMKAETAIYVNQRRREAFEKNLGARLLKSP